MATIFDDYDDSRISFSCEVIDPDFDTDKLRRFTEKNEKEDWKLGVDIKKSTFGWYRPIITVRLGKYEYKLSWVTTVSVNIKVKDWSISEC